MKKDGSHQFRSVGLARHEIGWYIVVHSVEEAADALLHGWPSDDEGEDFCEAVKMCFDGLHNRASPEDVRAALIKAAREAQVMVID